MKYLIRSLAFIIALATMSANAVPIVGKMEMSGGFHLIDSNGNTVNDALVATGIDFDFFGFNKFRATSGDGDFSGLAGQIGDISDFQFESFSSSIANFWSIDIFAFELTSVERGFTNDPANFLVLNGAGTISAGGFDDIAANWLFTGDTSGSGLLSWSATPSIPVPSVNVPEPSIFVLLSIGLLGFGLRKKF